MVSAWVTGTSAISCCSATPEELWEQAYAGASGTINGLGLIKGEVGTHRSVAIALKAIESALRASGGASLTDGDGLILASTTGQMPLWDDAYMQFVQNRLSIDELQPHFAEQPLGMLTKRICEEMKFRGPTLLVSSACSAATQAIALGKLWIEQGKVQRCLVGGVEVLCTLTVNGFRSLQLLSDEPTRPFDRHRKGINLSEAASFLVLESLPKKSPLACIQGQGFSSDSFHMTSPQPDGRGSLFAMRAALRTAGIIAQDLSWVHAHGTGSAANDLAEGLAITDLLGSAASAIPVSSTKHIHGHSLGASGALESVLCVEALRRQTILHTAGLLEPDPSIPLLFPLAPQAMPVRHILKNTLGFGGTNAAIVLSHPEAAHNG